MEEAIARCVPLGELWEGFHPAGISRGRFMLLRGYIDESVGKEQKLFALSCLISKGADWLRLETAWKTYLAGCNRNLKKQGRPTIPRYHASDCSNQLGDFDGWTREEATAFTKGLLRILRRSKTMTVAYDVNLDDLCEVFPEAAKDRLRAAYSLVTKFLISSIWHDQGTLDPLGKITLFHDRNPYDDEMLRSFNVMVKDTSWEGASYFTTIAPQSWEHCLPLQPADLIAYAMYKEADRRLPGNKRARGKALDVLLDFPAFGITSKTMDKATLIEIKEDAKRRAADARD
jgi:hypothetical protein